MQSPERLSVDELRDQLTGYLNSKCDLTGDAARCLRCKTTITAVDCYVSIHTTAFKGCAGYGTVEHVPIPYCRKCETKPSDMGCVHVEYFRGRNIIRAGGSLTQHLSDFVLSALIPHIRQLPTVE